MSVAVRDAELPRDKPALLRFIAGLNEFERQFESNRRLDAAFPEEFLAQLIDRAATKQGRLFVAEADGVPLGWAMCFVDEREIFVREEERPYGYVGEMFVDEVARGRHVGRLLLKASEDHFRALKLKTVEIGALAANTRAAGAYRAAGYSDQGINLRKLL